MTDMQSVIFKSDFAGLGNNESTEFSVDVPSQVIAANAAVTYTASAPLTRPTSISDVRLRYTGLDVLWYWPDGFQFFTDTSGDFTISTRVYIEDGVLKVRNFILDQTGVGFTLPAFTVDCRASLYNAPF